MGARGTEIAFNLYLADGRVAQCWQATSEHYLGCTFSAGTVSGIEPDCFYLRLEWPERGSKEPITILMREDEMLAMLHVCTGALWSASVIRSLLIE